MSKRVFSEIIDLTEDTPKDTPKPVSSVQNTESSVQDPQDPPPGYYFCPICWEHCKEEEAAATCAHGHRWCQPCVDGRSNVTAFPCPLCRDVSYWAPPVVAPIGLAAILHQTAVIQTLHEQIFGPDVSDDEEDGGQYDSATDPSVLTTPRDIARQVAREYAYRELAFLWETPYHHLTREEFRILRQQYVICGYEVIRHTSVGAFVSHRLMEYNGYPDWTFTFPRNVDRDCTIRVRRNN